MRVSFSRGQWDRSRFLNCANVRVPYRLEFGQEDGCIHNIGADRQGDKYAYVGLVCRDSLPLPCALET